MRVDRGGKQDDKTLDGNGHRLTVVLPARRAAWDAIRRRIFKLSWTRPDALGGIIIQRARRHLVDFVCGLRCCIPRGDNMSVVLIYKNDDAAYEAWYDAHHGSYAVNVHPGGTMLHRIPCSHIGRESTRPEHLLTANRKVCSESRGALLE